MEPSPAQEPLGVSSVTVLRLQRGNWTRRVWDWPEVTQELVAELQSALPCLLGFENNGCGQEGNGGCTDRVPLGHDRILSEGRRGGRWKGHPAPAALALEARAGQLCEVWRPSGGPAVSAVTTWAQDPESEKGLWSKTAQPLGFPALPPSRMANTGVEAHVPLWEYLWAGTPPGARDYVVSSTFPAAPWLSEGCFPCVPMVKWPQSGKWTPKLLHSLPWRGEAASWAASAPGGGQRAGSGLSRIGGSRAGMQGAPASLPLLEVDWQEAEPPGDMELVGQGAEGMHLGRGGPSRQCQGLGGATP